jgi:hypothetical protein
VSLTVGVRVLGLVPTLTSERAVINLSMVGANGNTGTRILSRFRPRDRTSSRLRVCNVLIRTKGACSGGRGGYKRGG